jgi:hypothetical protein
MVESAEESSYDEMSSEMFMNGDKNTLKFKMESRM